jgi:antitoxin ChpS
MYQTLRRAGGSLVMTVPKTFVDQNQLHEGSQVQLTVQGNKMVIISAAKPRYHIQELMQEMPDGLPMVEGWDELNDVGLEQS